MENDNILIQQIQDMHELLLKQQKITDDNEKLLPHIKFDEFKRGTKKGFIVGTMFSVTFAAFVLLFTYLAFIKPTLAKELALEKDKSFLEGKVEMHNYWIKDGSCDSLVAAKKQFEIFVKNYKWE
jgi:hypothetical protein